MPFHALPIGRVTTFVALSIGRYIAEALSKHKYMLVLSNLEKLSKKAKESLVKHKNVIPDLKWF
jgi:hypothetical protein